MDAGSVSILTFGGQNIKMTIRGKDMESMRLMEVEFVSLDVVCIR
jgi:hypothetical protein